MEYLITALEVTMALFAVIGIYCMARLLSQRLYGSRRVILAVELLTEQSLTEAESAIRDALCQFLLVPSGRVCVITTPALCGDENLLTLIKKYGVPLKVIEPKEK